MIRDQVIQDAIDAMPGRPHGKLASLAEALGISSQALSQWERVPVVRVLQIERLTGIPREKLRPDIYAPRPSHFGPLEPSSKAAE